MNRRAFLATLPATALAARFTRRASAQSRYRTRAILLGTAGGPSPKRGRSAPASVDVLVHEVLYPDAYAGQAEGNARSVARHILESHTPVEEVGKLAQEAGVKTLVLSHFVPDNNAEAEQNWLPLARRHFKGEVILGRDLMEI
ncbi:MAG TPA: hypothetical protein VKD69_15720 [Vicinamibacterales bacterium]|nr:hypothetical protein [Vicinamibacterales bacterium]